MMEWNQYDSRVKLNSIRLMVSKVSSLHTDALPFQNIEFILYVEIFE